MTRPPHKLAPIREAIDEKLSSTPNARAQASDRLLAAKPMPVHDWPVMKKQMLEDRYARVTHILDTYN
jgi:hypothetical protein